MVRLPEKIPGQRQPQLSIVVPVLDEAEQLDTFLTSLVERLPEETEVLVVDGGSKDNSVGIVKQHPVKLISSARGRALQMNAGARQALGTYLMFLHADTMLPRDFKSEFEWWIQSQPIWGFAPVRLLGEDWWCRLVEGGINLRTRITAGASGDQAQIVQSKYFSALGGFAEIQLMEDIELSYRLRRLWPARRFRLPVTTSSRRWQRGGVVRTVLLMWFLRSSYRLGVSPVRLARWYAGA